MTTIATPARPPNATPSGGQAADGVPHQVVQTVGELVGLENRDKVEMGWSDHLADMITAFSGSMLFVGMNALWFGAWILVNLTGILEFDPYPFGLLTMIVSLEAIFLSTFVLISQNRAALRSDRRAKVDLQVNALAEAEITKVLHLVAEIHDELGLHKHKQDDELESMKQQTTISQLADAVEAVESQGDGPGSAVDTES